VRLELFADALELKEGLARGASEAFASPSQQPNSVADGEATTFKEGRELIAQSAEQGARRG
jgi:hypothetical protein